MTQILYVVNITYVSSVFQNILNQNIVNIVYIFL